MIERDLMLDGSAAIVLAVLAWHVPGVARRFGRGGLALFVAGVLLPFLDPGLFHLLAVDRIELLSRPPLVQAPLLALGLIAALAVLVACAATPRRALAVALGLGAGYALHALLALLTPVGWPLLAPFSGARVMLPILPAGHLVLLGVAFAGLVLAEALPRWRRGLVVGTLVLAGAYGLAGAVQYAILTARVQPLASADAQVQVYPDGNSLARWEVVLEGPQRYELRRARALTQPLPEPRVLPRWNDEALFLKLLGDPVVSRFYFRVFHHPVVRLDVSGAQITLLMQELEDQSPLVPGPTFYLESDLSGRNRFYQLQRFN